MTYTRTIAEVNRVFFLHGFVFILC